MLLPDLVSIAVQHHLLVVVVVAFRAGRGPEAAARVAAALRHLRPVVDRAGK